MLLLLLSLLFHPSIYVYIIFAFCFKDPIFKVRDSEENRFLSIFRKKKIDSNGTQEVICNFLEGFIA